MTYFEGDTAVSAQRLTFTVFATISKSTGHGVL